MFTSLLKDMIKDTDEQPDEEIHRVRWLSSGIYKGKLGLPWWRSG